MIEKTTEQMLQTVVLTLIEVSKRLTRTEAKITQLMLHQGMSNDGRVAIELRKFGHGRL